ncbi:MAG: hypothetical protein MUF25_14530, partial [Pirellulaceae bacterium]|nr:hypothetical protein [Pirellulaceae bacterium]
MSRSLATLLTIAVVITAAGCLLQRLKRLRSDDRLLHPLSPIQRQPRLAMVAGKSQGLVKLFVQAIGGVENLPDFLALRVGIPGVEDDRPGVSEIHKFLDTTGRFKPRFTARMPPRGPRMNRVADNLQTATLRQPM